MGLRVPYDTSPQKPEGTFRVLVIGDSVTWGQPPLEGLFTYRLELLLEQQLEPPVEVLNFSMPGLSLRQEVSMLEPQHLVSYRQDESNRTHFNALGHDAISVVLGPLIVNWIAAQGADGQAPPSTHRSDERQPEHSDVDPITD